MPKAFALKEGVERHPTQNPNQKNQMKRQKQDDLEHAINAGIGALIDKAKEFATDKENLICYGSIFDSPISTEKADAAFKKLVDALDDCRIAIDEAVENALENERENEIEKAAQKIADSILSPYATDAEAFEQVYELAAKKIREHCQSINDRDFAQLIGGTVCDFGKTLQGKKPNRPWDA